MPLLLLLPLLLTACAGLHQKGHAPNVVVEDAHAGGTALAFQPQTDRLASGGRSGWVRIWSPDGERLANWRAHRSVVSGLAFVGEDGTRLITAGEDGVLALWDTDGNLQHKVTTKGRIDALAVAGDTAITGHSDGKVRRWRVTELAQLDDWQAHKRAVRAVAWHGPSDTIAASASDGGVSWWRVGGTPHPLPAPPTDASSLTFSPDGALLFGGGWFRLFRWDLQTASLTVLPTEHQGAVVSMQYTADGRHIATISRHTDSSVYFLDPQSGAVDQRFWRHDLCGAAIQVSPDGRYLATTSDDASVRIWDLENLLPPSVYYIPVPGDTP